jgi:(2R)-3-sulfolactate dehydrogenase (NADP+)
MSVISISDAQLYASTTLRRAGFTEKASEVTARALVLAECQGLASHGLSRIPQYIAHLRNGRINAKAEPAVAKRKQACVVVDAQSGLAFPACELAIDEGIQLAREFGISLSAVVNSHHAGVMADHLRRPVEAGLVGLGFSNAPAVMPTAGGRSPLFGTNPIAAAFPRRSAPPLLIDLSLSEVTRGTLVAAAKLGKQIPLGWAVDSRGVPTNDPQAALKGSMLAIGSATSGKGAMLAMMIELFASALIGANFSFEASSFFVDSGNVPRLGHTFVFIDPNGLAGSGLYFNRLEVFISELLTDDNVRLPGARREALLQKSMADGLEIQDSLLSLLTGSD